MRGVERRGGGWRRVNEMQEWADRDSWRLLSKNQLTNVEEEEEVDFLKDWYVTTGGNLTINYA
jgi:hypothetical protein